MAFVGRLLGLLYRRAPSDAATPRTAPGPRRRRIAIRATPTRVQAIVLGVVPPLLTLLAWELATLGAEPESRFISPVLLPSPAEVVASFPSLWARGLAGSVVVSLGRVLAGFAIAAAVALPLGVLMGAFGKIRAVFQPLAVMGSYVPVAALVPLTILWFKTGELQKVMFLAIASFAALLPLVVKAVDDVDQVHVNTAFTLGATPARVVTKVLLPIAWPDLFNAMRLTLAIGWTYIILAEVVGADRGLGALIHGSQRRGLPEHMYLVLVVIMAIAFVIDRGLLSLFRLLFPYRRDAA